VDLRALLRLAPAFKPFKAWDADSIVMPPYSRQRSGPCPEFFHIAQNVACELQYSPGTLRHQSRQKRYRMREVRPCLAGEPKQLPHDLLAPFHISRVSGLFRFDHAVNLWKGNWWPETQPFCSTNSSDWPSRGEIPLRSALHATELQPAILNHPFHLGACPFSFYTV
jgi:hypothetical protein